MSEVDFEKMLTENRLALLERQLADIEQELAALSERVRRLQQWVVWRPDIVDEPQRRGDG